MMKLHRLIPTAILTLMASAAMAQAINNEAANDSATYGDTLKLEGVVVEGKRVHKTAKGYEFFLSQKARECGNPFLALAEIPLLHSDFITQTLTYADGSPVILLVDGMQVNSGVSPIDPEMIKSVEIEEMAGAKYRNAGTSRVVNIKLKKDIPVYLYNQLSASGDASPLKGSGAWQFEVGNKAVSVYGMLSESLRRDEKISREYSMQAFGNDRSYHGTDMQSGNFHYYAFMLKLRLTEKDYMAIYGQGNIAKSWDDLAAYGSDNGQDLSRKERKEFHSDIFAVTAYHRHAFSDREKLETYLKYSSNGSDSNGNTDELIGSTPISTLQWYDSDRKLGSMNNDYEKRFAKGSILNIGNEIAYIYNRIDGSAETGGAFGLHQLNEYFYAGYSGMVKRLSYSGSAGLEYVLQKSQLHTNRYFRPRIACNLSYSITSGLSAKGSYSLQAAAPTIAMLNPYNTSADSLIVTCGNPYLKPQLTHISQIGISYMRGTFMVSADAKYSYTDDIAQMISFADDDAVLTQTYANNGHFSSLSLSGTMRYIKKGWTVMLNAAHNFDYYTGLSAKRYLNTYLYVNKRVGKFNFAASMLYMNYLHTLSSRTKYYNPITSSLNVSYSFNTNTTLTIGLNQITGKPRSLTTISTEGYTSTSLTKRQMLSPWIQFRWTLRKNNRKKINLDNYIMKQIDETIKL